MDNPTNFDAGDLISRARSLHRQLRTPANSLEIRQLLQEALADPVGFEPRVAAETWSLLAELLMCDYLNGWNNSGATQLKEAENAVGRALEIAPGQAAAHYATGLIHRARGEHEPALAAFTRTVELSPKFALAHAQQGAQLIYTGRPLEALQPIDTAIRISRPDNPSLPMFFWYKGRAHFVSDNYPDAIECLQRSVNGRDNVWYNHLHLVSAYALNKDSEAATAVLRRFDDRFPNYTMSRVIQNEQANPHSNPTMVAAREKFHDGLRLAGMPE